MKYLFLSFFLYLSQSSFSQEVMTLHLIGISHSGDSYPLLKQMSGEPFVFQFSTQLRQTNYFAVKPVPSFNSLPSLFCKLEYKLETKSKLAPRFRLGSLQYSNWMEGKGDFYSRY
jgi:hypothetical protein